jgi:uncharacterized protein (TIGR02058 family)
MVPDGQFRLVSRGLIAMTLKRFAMEFGMGTDLQEADYTKAAVRALKDAMRHSSLPLYWPLGLDPAAMQVNVTIGVQKPDQVDVARVAKELPHGKINVKAVKGWLNVPEGRFTLAE